MDPHRITLTIEGTVSDEGHVRLRDFLTQLRALSAALHQLELMQGDGDSKAYYRIVALRHDSPATVELERVEPRGRSDRPVIPSLFGALREIEEDRVPDASKKLLTSLKALSAPVGRTVRSTVVSSNGDAMNVTSVLREKVNRLLAPETSARGGVSGMLERINFHASANTFHLYPIIGPQRVACRFPAGLTEVAERAVNKYVKVRGELRYKSDAEFPYAVEVAEIDVMAQEHRLPSLSELRGAAPDATEGEPVTEFVWRVRDDW